MLRGLLKSLSTAVDTKPQFDVHSPIQWRKTKNNFEVALNNEDPWFKPSNCERFDKNL